LALEFSFKENSQCVLPEDGAHVLKHAEEAHVMFVSPAEPFNKPNTHQIK
jgi:hypothetical protein